MQPLFWDPMQISPKENMFFFPERAKVWSRCSPQRSWCRRRASKTRRRNCWPSYSATKRPWVHQHRRRRGGDGMGWDGTVVSKGGRLQSFVFNKATKRHKKYTQKRLKLLSIGGSKGQTLRVEDQTYGKQWHWNDNKWNIYLQNRVSTI